MAVSPFLLLFSPLSPCITLPLSLHSALQDNVALIAVLEAIEPGPPDATTRRTLICVANTHIHANPELNDVKLWKVHTLLKGLEKIAARCGGRGGGVNKQIQGKLSLVCFCVLHDERALFRSPSSAPSAPPPLSSAD